MSLVQTDVFFGVRTSNYDAGCFLCRSLYFNILEALDIRNLTRKILFITLPTDYYDKIKALRTLFLNAAS